MQIERRNSKRRLNANSAKGNQQSRSEKVPGTSSLISGFLILLLIYQPAQIPYDKLLQDLVEEINTKRRLEYKVFEHSDRPKK